MVLPPAPSSSYVSLLMTARKNSTVLSAVIAARLWADAWIQRICEPHLRQYGPPQNTSPICGIPQMPPFGLNNMISFPENWVAQKEWLVCGLI